VSLLNGIGSVTTALTLVAFIAALAAWAYARMLLQKERLIRSAPEEKRAPLVEKALEWIHVESRRLTKQQQYDLAMEQIRRRAERSRWSAVIIMLVAILAAAVSVIALSAAPSRPQEGDSDLNLSSLDKPDRIVPLDGHPVLTLAPDARPVYTGGARVSLTLTHNKHGNHSITIWGMKLLLLSYQHNALPQLTYAPALKDIIGSGSVKPNIFHVGLEGWEVRPATWVRPDGTTQRARNANFLDTDEPRRLALRNSEDDIEEVECTILAKKAGLYEAQFAFFYNVNGVDREKRSEPFLIYDEE
jgi:hypothetical protein